MVSRPKMLRPPIGPGQQAVVEKRQRTDPSLFQRQGRLLPGAGSDPGSPVPVPKIPGESPLEHLRRQWPEWWGSLSEEERQPPEVFGKDRKGTKRP